MTLKWFSLSGLLLLLGCAARKPVEVEVAPNWTITHQGTSIVMSDPCPQGYYLFIVDTDHPAVCRLMR